MTDTTTEAAGRDAAFDALLRSNPDLLVAALAPDGFRVPMPADVGLADDRLIPVPADRATMIDLVVPGDTMTVITAWERAARQGVAIETVHTRGAPDRRVALTFIDMRHRYGGVAGRVFRSG